MRLSGGNQEHTASPFGAGMSSPTGFRPAMPSRFVANSVAKEMACAGVRYLSEISVTKPLSIGASKRRSSDSA